MAEEAIGKKVATDLPEEVKVKVEKEDSREEIMTNKNKENEILFLSKKNKTHKYESLLSPFVIDCFKLLINFLFHCVNFLLLLSFIISFNA